MISCSCVGNPVAAIPNNQCDAPRWGSQIQAIFFQKMEGSPFNGQPITDGTTGGDITVQADWEAKLAASGDDKIIAMINLAGTSVADAARTEQSGNDVPGGGLEVTDLTRQIIGRLQYPSNATIDGVNASRCIGLVRVWVVDNAGYVQGGDNGIENVKINFDALKRDGIGGLRPHFPFTLDWSDLEEKEMSEATQGWLLNLDNGN